MCEHDQIDCVTANLKVLLDAEELRGIGSLLLEENEWVLKEVVDYLPDRIGVGQIISTVELLRGSKRPPEIHVLHGTRTTTDQVASLNAALHAGFKTGSGKPYPPPTSTSATTTKCGVDGEDAASDEPPRKVARSAEA